MLWKKALSAIMMAAVCAAEAQAAEAAEADGPVAESSDELTKAQTACTIACATLAGACVGAVLVIVGRKGQE